jgi:hypothetical protein
MRRVNWAYSKTWEGSSAPARSSAEASEPSLIRTRTIPSPCAGRRNLGAAAPSQTSSLRIYRANILIAETGEQTLTQSNPSSSTRRLRSTMP